MSRQEVLARAEIDREEHLEILLRLLRQPSISARDEGVRECAELVAETLAACGIPARLIPTQGQPVVYGELAGAHPDAPTVLFYGHYDVQPPDPLEEWSSPPFEPAVRDGRIYARGAGDNKGQFIAHALAIRCFLRTIGSVPLNVEFVLEGEEEIGSHNLSGFVEANRDILDADLVYIADGCYDDSGRPTVSLGVRGMLAVELEVRGAKSDLHSGSRGNVVPNPAWELIELLHTMRAADGRVLIEGFYDGVRKPTHIELEYAQSIPFDPETFAAAMGLDHVSVNTPAEYYSRLMFEPTFNIAGLVSGYGGKGIKTIVPSRATVKMDMRLVADQDPNDVFQKLVAHVDKNAQDVEVRHLGAIPPSRTSADHPEVQAIVHAVRAARDAEPVVVPSLGASLPMYVWTDILGIPAVVVPYANPDENNHAPNENIEMEAFFAGIRTSVYVIEALGNRT